MKLTHLALTGLILLLSAGFYLTMKTDMDGRMEEMKADADRKFELLQKAIKDGQQAVPAPPEAPPVPVVAAAPAAARQAVPPPALPVTAETPEAGKTPAPAVPETPAAAEAPAENFTAGPGPVLPPSPDAAPPGVLEKEQDILNNSAATGSDRIAEEAAGVTGAAPEAVRMTKLQSMVLAQPAIARIKDNKEAAGFVVIDRGQNANLAKGDVYAVRRGTAIIGRVVLTDNIQESEAVADVDPAKLVTGMVLQRGDELIKFDR